jgi:glucose/arabinose dehydrogenase
MMYDRNRFRIASLLLATLAAAPAAAQSLCKTTLTGTAALSSGWKQDAPLTCRQINPADIPAPIAGVGNAASLIDRPPGLLPKAPPGFTVSIAYSGPNAPRILRTAPNGDIFVAESEAGQVRVLRPDGQGGFAADHVFAQGLKYPFGIAFFPPNAADPTFVYVGQPATIVRYPYHNGDMVAAGPAEPVVAGLPDGGNHITRDVVFTPDGTRMFVGVGSASNDAENGEMTSGAERNRAVVMASAPDGGGLTVFASGIRNASGLAIEPTSGKLWATVNERDLQGDNVPPDYLTHVAQGQFYGWPWFYIGDHPDPWHKAEAPDAGPVAVPDLLFAAHSAPLGLTFGAGLHFPDAYRHGAFVAAHGSWNRINRNEGKVMFVPAKPDGTPGPLYVDFLTGFTVTQADTPDHTGSWGRPVGIAVGKDGALYVSDDWARVIWRVTYAGNLTE